MKRRTRSASSVAETHVFDDEGVRLAMLAALESIHRCFPQITLLQYLIALEVRKAEREGTPHTLASLVKKLRMPFSTASRVAWSLTKEGGKIGVIRYLSHPTDRRKKQLVVDRQNAFAEVSIAAMHAMHAYYGDSVIHLRRVLA